MRHAVITALLCAAAWLALSTAAQGHGGGSAAPAVLPGVPAFSANLFGSRSPQTAVRAGAAPRAIDGTDASTFEGGPCTGAAKGAFADGDGHDHLDVSQHRFACNMQQIAFLPLVKELAGRPDVVLGEMDVKADIAAVAVAYPEGGALFFDVKDPRNPKFLSWYRGGECEGAVIDVDCGAFIDLSADGKTAFLSTQNTSVLPGSLAVGVPTTIPGVYTLDISDPTRPRLTDVYPVANLGGIHTARSHVIPGKGEYVFTNTLSGQGLTSAKVDILKLDRIAGLPRLTLVNSIEFDELHDMFIQQDPLDGRTYMYVASGFASGFYVHDVTDPAAPVLKAEWDLTPQCAQDWYSHTIDVAVRGGRRYVTLPTESIASFGEQSAEDRAEGCGTLVGNGDVPGVLWIVDATDFAKLGPAEPVGEDDDPALAAASKAALVATWSNPAGRAGGNLQFSPHNQQIVGDEIILSDYHGGVHVLDASAAFAGRKVRPKEVGFIVPHGTETRPIYKAQIAPAIPFFSGFPPGRSSLWDAYAYKGVIYVADMYGGFYAIEKAPTTAAPGTPAAGTPVLDTTVGFKVVRTKGGKASCTNARLSARLSGKGVRAVRRVQFLAGKRSLGTDRKAPFTLSTTRRKVGKARSITVRVTFVDGTTKRITRRIRACVR